MGAARESFAAAELSGITITCADAGDFAAYRSAVPADLVLLAGVLGNISDHDVAATIAALPRLCAHGATVIWTRTRRDPDLTLPSVAGSPTPTLPSKPSMRRRRCCSLWVYTGSMDSL